MNHQLKGLAAVLATVVLASVGPATASAAEFQAANAPVKLAGTQSIGHVLTTVAGNMTCKTVTLAGGEMAAKTAAEITFTPNYEGCTAFGFIKVPVHENKCTMTFAANKVWSINCAAGEAIEITAPGCTTKIGSQPLIGAMAYVNNGAKSEFEAVTNVVAGIAYNECGVPRFGGAYSGGTTISGNANVWFE